MNHRTAGFQASFCNRERVIEFAMQVELKMTQWDHYLAVCIEKSVQYSCTVNSAGGRQETVCCGTHSVSTLTVLH